MNSLTLSKRLKLSDLGIKLNPEINKRVLVELANRIGTLYKNVADPEIIGVYKGIYEQISTKNCSEFALEYWLQEVRDLCTRLKVEID